VILKHAAVAHSSSILVEVTRSC